MERFTQGIREHRLVFFEAMSTTPANPQEAGKKSAEEIGEQKLNVDVSVQKAIGKLEHVLAEVDPARAKLFAQLAAYHTTCESTTTLARRGLATPDQMQRFLAAINGAIQLIPQLPEFHYRLQYYRDLQTEFGR